MMKALCYIKPGVIRFQSVPRPQLVNSTDVVGKVVMGTICGSDLHIIKGHLPSVDAVAAAAKEAGIVLGHEGVIEIEQVGSDVTKFKPGDVCIVSCISPCGKCYYCKQKCQSHCLNTELIGIQINGTQAEFVRVPNADQSLHKCPEGVPLESCMMLSDILPTSYEMGVLNGEVRKGSRVAIVGLGPVGLAALLSAKSLEPEMIVAVDLDDNRLKLAKKLGADLTINPSKENPVEKIMAIPTAEGKLPGMDTAIECVGSDATFDICQRVIAPLGVIANLGVQPKPCNLAMDEIWGKNIKMVSGVVNGTSTQSLLDKIVKGTLDPSPLVTHHFKFSEYMKAYDVFSHASETGAVKVAIVPDD